MKHLTMILLMPQIRRIPIKDALLSTFEPVIDPVVISTLLSSVCECVSIACP